ncbi:MAG TPA: NAD(P)/FAD-dependent oxidoreductase [Candidatus Polarisedimenticolia bacterium]|nr:NAD(P)/FAD-dependent oxidoreductase [Candidatus Polarisedimenticolia bacterium]
MTGRARFVADVLVVGGGPAGATAASLLSREGFEVLLLEKRPRGGQKVCGEFLSSEGVGVLERLGVLDALKGRGAVPIRLARIHPPSGEPCRLLLPRGHQASGLGLSRALLDETLISCSAASGARVLRGARLTGLAREKDGWRARIRRGDRTERVRARLLLGADGRNSRVAALTELGGPPCGLGLGMQVHFRRAAEPEECVDLFLLRDGYAGLAPVESGRWCLGALLPVPPKSSDPFARLAASLSPRARPETFHDSSPDVLDRCTAFPIGVGWRSGEKPGVLLCGDAAGSVDPFSGQGIALALLGGEAAAECLRGIMRGREIASRRAYAAFLKTEVGARLSVTKPLRALLRRPRINQGLIAVMRRYPFLGERLLGLTRNAEGPYLGALPRLAARLLMR